ncbi:MAG TPA: glycosyltransferase family 2 protein [Opitutaceae bacterium]
MSDSESKPALAVVIPVYNEQDCIVPVLEEWRAALTALKIHFVLLVIDDGSKDETPSRLKAINWPHLKVHRHSNRGHGQSCLVGYQIARDLGAEFVFQIDSDGQCDPASFARIWNRRAEAPAIYGRRLQRDDGVARKIISFVLRCLLKASWHTRLNDANVPYRLYGTETAARGAERVPTTFDLANIGLALLLEPEGFIEEPIHFRDRLGGHPSVRWWGFARKAKRLLRDLKTLRHAQAL